MIFNSFTFVFFFIVVTTLFYLIPHRFRWFLLVAASVYFYMYFIPIYILILLLTIIIDYIAGIWIGKSTGATRKMYLIVSIIANVGVLFFFKYFNFFNDNLIALCRYLDIAHHDLRLDIILPIGLSFHTFQAMSYTIEVYRGAQKPERHLGIYTLYVLFYPQLVAGPIERPQNLLHQFHEIKRFDIRNLVEGLKLIVWGLFKKVVVADRLTLYVDSVYGNYEHHNGASLLLATYFFSFQIYCDFSGYSDIARGSARAMGYDLMVNFNKPYFSKTISEFWTRWHISLSTWFKDYLYIPLGGNQVTKMKWYRNLVIVFLVSGLWHGANWTFVIWGGIHALALIVGIATKSIRSGFWEKQILIVRQIRPLLAAVLVFNIVSLAWIYFRAPSAGVANAIFTGILTNFNFSHLYIGEKSQIIYSFAAIAALLYFERPFTENSFVEFLKLKKPISRLAIYVFLILTIMLIGVSDGEQFIYFQF